MISMDYSAFQQTALQGTQPVLVLYSAPWCGYCRRLQPVLRRISREYAAQVTFATVDIEAEPQLSREEQIEVVPTLVLYHKGSVLGSVVVPECGERIEALLQDSLPAGT